MINQDLQVDNDLHAGQNSSTAAANSVPQYPGPPSRSDPPPVSPSIEEKIDILEQHNSDSKFLGMTLLENKRKSEGSPEADLSRKEKKIQKSEGKKNKKNEGKASRTLNLPKTF